MNIQIFGSKKDNDTKKAQRFFKERGIRFQYIDLREKTLSKGEFRSFAMADRRHWDISWELSNITFAGTVTTQGEKSIHCRRCGERSHIVKYSLEDEKNSSNDNEDTEYGRKITYSYLLKGSLFKAKGLRYRVNAVNAKKGIFDVTCMDSNSKKIKKITVPNYVKYKGIHYRVTGIGKNAFAGCRKVKTVKIQSMYLKKKNIGKNAFRGIPRKASVYVPPGKMKSYRKWLKKAGLK